MKCVKIIGLLAVATATLMVSAGSASAITLTDQAGNVLGTPGATSELHAKSVGSSTLDGTINVSCQQSTIRGSISSPHHVKVSLTSITFEQCGNHTVTVIDKGMLTIEGNGDNTTGTVFSSDLTVTILTHSIFLGTRHCNYATDNTHIGTLTESDHTPSGGFKHTTATMHVGATITGEITDGLCGHEEEWTATYEFTHPDHIYIDS